MFSPPHRLSLPVPATVPHANQQFPRFTEGFLMQELLEYAASSQDEVCALIINDTRVYPCRNVHPDPAHHFRISDDDWLAAEEAGEVTAVFHSHPQAVPVLSGADRAMQVMTALPWWLACNGELRKFRPVAHLLGRRFAHGVTDCYTLFAMRITCVALTCRILPGQKAGGCAERIST